MHSWAPAAAVAAVGLAWIAAAPATADLAAHTYRAWLWQEHGFTVWNGQWYGGHHVPAYSLTFPPLAAWLGVRVAVALAGVLAAAALAALARDTAPRRGALAGWLLAAGVAANVVVGRGPFTLGIGCGALALLLARRRRLPAAAAAALACVWSSPVAGVFLLLAAAAWLAARRTAAARALVVAVPAVAGGLALAALFPEGGEERFVATAFWPMLALSAAAVALLGTGGREPSTAARVLRAAGALYVLLLVAAFVLPTPMGQNALRLGVLAGPAALAAGAPGRRVPVVLVGAGLLYLQWLPAVRAVAEAAGDPAARAAFHRPLLAFLERAAAPGDRLEIAFTRNHWEAAHVAPHIALARGWERQLDLAVNPLFYDGAPLTPARYERWLRREAIRWVALPDAPLDFSARAEAALLRRRQPFLRQALRTAGWTVFELRPAPPAVRGPGRITAAGPDFLELAAPRPGRLVIGRRHTRHWTVRRGSACVRPAAGGRTAVDVRAAGALRLEARLGGPRCD